MKTQKLLSVLVVVLCGTFDFCCSEAKCSDGVLPFLEEEWIMQAKAAAVAPSHAAVSPGGVPGWADAAGAVDGVKNGLYAFHTGLEKTPWWQVDLGKAVQVERIVVYNRLDYQPGLHNADSLVILFSSDEKSWTQVYDNKGKYFGGVSGAKPLQVDFDKQIQRTRFVRLQVQSKTPVFFHLDEVEVYGFEKPDANIALMRPADQSSISIWSKPKPNAIAIGDFAKPLKAACVRGKALAEDLGRKGVDVKWFYREIVEVMDQFKTDMDSRAQRELYFKARRCVRRLVFSNPLFVEKLLLVKRFTQQTYPDICLNHMPWVSRPGGDICVVTFSGPFAEPAVETLLNGALGPGHVHGMDLSWDAKRIVFGYARTKTGEPPEGWLDRRTSYRLRRDEEPIHIFELMLTDRSVRQVTDGPWSDLDPTYAPNGDIVFVSERCACSLQCNEYDKDETSCNLYSCRPDGSHITHLSVSKDGDYLPHALSDGTIGYTRWEYQERGWAHIQSIWTIRPDGTGADALYKQHMNNPWALEDVRSIPGSHSKKLVAIAAGHHTLAAGPVVLVSARTGLNNPRGIEIVTQGVKPPEGGMAGEAVATGGVADMGGFYMTPWPLSEKYFLVSYTYSGTQTDPAGYALYLIDVFGNKELLYKDPAISCFVPYPLRPRKRPPLVRGYIDKGKRKAACYVAKAAHGTGLAQGRVRYIRISHRLQWPYDNTYGGQRYAEKAWPYNWTPARIIGTVPVEADGSAYFEVPPDVPVYFQLLDEEHKELQRMRAFISFQPGEVRGCVGCHETRAEAAGVPAMPSALKRPPSIPVPPPWGRQAVSFLRDIQPVFDRNCVSCHSGLAPEAGLDFSGGLTRHHNVAFDTLYQHKLISYSEVQGDASITEALAFGSHKSRLLSVIGNENHQKRVELTPLEKLSLTTWIDANAPYHDGFINKRPERPPYNLPVDRGLQNRITEIHRERCSACHKAEAVSRLDWIDMADPRSSRFLAAPLSKDAGGAARCKEAVYSDRSDPDYQRLFKLVEAAAERAVKFPRRDLRYRLWYR